MSQPAPSDAELVRIVRRARLSRTDIRQVKRICKQAHRDGTADALTPASVRLVCRAHAERADVPGA